MLGDPTRLRQIAWHLLANAIKFTPRGGTVGSDARTVRRAARADRADSGPGIDPEFLPRIFDRFTQEDPSPTRRPAGWASACRSSAISSSCTAARFARATATGSRGAMFTARFPLHPVASEVSGNAGAAAPVSDVAAARRPARAACSIRMPTAASCCGRCSSNAAPGPDGGLGRRSARGARGLAPDVLVSDSVTPEHDSYALVGKVRSLEAERGGRIPAAALTALARTDERVRHMLEPVQTRSAEAGRAGRAHRGDRPAHRARARARAQRSQLTATSWRHHAQRRLSAGVEIQADGGAHARVWAPAAVGRRRAATPIAAACWPLAASATAISPATSPDARAGDRYWCGSTARCSGPIRRRAISRTVRTAVGDRRPLGVPLDRRGWHGIAADGQVIYELHVGTFTPEGTWRAAAAELEALADLGITIVEMMPIADFAGRFGWGYDGVNLYAPTRLYGTPDDLRGVRRSRARARPRRDPRRGLQPRRARRQLPGGLLAATTSPTATRTTGARRSTSKAPPPARAFFVENAGYWIDEFHFDGLRLDATQDIHDASPEHVVADIDPRARARRPARARSTSSPRTSRRTRRSSAIRRSGGYGVDALWNDDYTTPRSWR